MKDVFLGVDYAIVDLNKSTSNLVPKKVPIKQDNGKVTYGIRWVNPNKDLGSEEGGRVSSGEEIPPSIQAIMDNNTPEVFDEDPSKEEPKSPNAEEPSYEDASTIDYSMYHSGVMGDDRLSSYMQDFNSQSYMFADGDSVDYTMEQAANIAKNHKDSIKSILLDDIAKMENPDLFIQNVQRAMIKAGKVEQSNFTILGSNPKILKQSLMVMLGKEKYKALSEDLKSSNLTINTPPENITPILDNGYKGQSIEDAFSQWLSPDEVQEHMEQFDEILSEYDQEEDMMDAILELGYDDKIWNDIHTRLEAESNNMCISPEDRRPCYVAFNASGDDSGPTSLYGKGVVGVSDDILNHCTVSKDDSFMTDDCMPKVYGKDHLHDLYLLKMCESNYNLMNQGTEDILNSDWKTKFTSESNLPLEVQYHKPIIPESKLYLINEGF